MQPLGSKDTKLEAEEKRISLTFNSYKSKSATSTKDSDLKKRINDYALQYVFFCCASIAFGVTFASTLVAIGIGSLSLTPFGSVAILVVTAASALVCADRAVRAAGLKFHAEEKLIYG